MRHPLVFALTLLSAPLVAQQATHTVAPGMTKAQVITALGQPATSRTVSEYTYLFYTNTCGTRCGMNDLVVLHGDSVVDAIFRSPSRHYSGVSSSPTPVPPEVATRKKPAAAGAPLKVPAEAPPRKAVAKPVAPPPTTKAAAKPAEAPVKPAPKPTQMKPGPPNDTKPSIPVKPPAVKPAPTTTKPATKTP